jgi:hypothetical protein
MASSGSCALAPPVVICPRDGPWRTPASRCSRWHGVPPDLIVYFGDPHWLSVGSVGMGSICTFDHDTGPDEATHDCYGIFMVSRLSSLWVGAIQGETGNRPCLVASVVGSVADSGKLYTESPLVLWNSHTPFPLVG